MARNVRRDDAKKVISFLIDFIFVVIFISIINLIVVSLFGLSESALMRKGVETSFLERKLEIYDYVSLGYFAFVIFYLAYLRGFYSLGNILVNKKK